MKLVQVFLFSILFMQLYSQKTLSWKLFDHFTKKNIDFGTKGSVQQALIHSGILPEPFVGTNETKFIEVERKVWTVFSEIQLSEVKKNTKYLLLFPNIDTYATVLLNGKEVGTSENAFVSYEFDVSQFLVVGLNKIEVKFTPPTMFHKAAYEKMKFLYPAPNDVGDIMIASLCRKPQFQFGWDWALRMTTMGFWEDVTFIERDKERVIKHLIQMPNQLNETSNSADFELSLELDEKNNTIYTWKSELFGDMAVKAVDGKLNRSGEILNPILWWPNGEHSSPAHLYNDTWVLLNNKGQEIFKKEFKFGVRSCELIQEKDEWGTSFYFKINGRKVFCKGGDYIPDDIFINRITDEKLVDQVATMQNCNFNMVRVWGGGYYPRESFLNACDSLGIMVWQDFMFACSVYPSDQHFLDNVENELNQQIPRIASHPSVVYFNGNNEVMVAMKYWGFNEKYRLNKEAQESMKKGYDAIFKQLIPQTLAKYTSFLPYEHTSPLSHWGQDEFYKHGTQHYWGVWHGTDPMTDFARKSGRFNAEYGFQSFPEFSTLKSFSSKEQWQLNSEVMNHHQKSYVGNGMIKKHADLLYGESSNFKEFVYFSQLTQAHAVSTAIMSHRWNADRVGGTLFWQVNDCWPAPTWSSIDYNLNWKALQYQVKKDFNDLAIGIYTDENLKNKLVLINDTPAGFLCRIEAKIYNSKGELLQELNCKRSLFGKERELLFENELATYKEEIFVSIHWNSGLKNHENVFLFNAEKSQKTDSLQFTQCSFDESTKKGTLTFTVSSPMKNVWIYSEDSQIHFENNFNHLLPGNYLIDFTSEKKILLTQLEFMQCK